MHVCVWYVWKYVSMFGNWMIDLAMLDILRHRLCKLSIHTTYYWCQCKLFLRYTLIFFCRLSMVIQTHCAALREWVASPSLCTTTLQSQDRTTAGERPPTSEEDPAKSCSATAWHHAICWNPFLSETAPCITRGDELVTRTCYNEIHSIGHLLCKWILGLF